MNMGAMRLFIIICSGILGSIAIGAVLLAEYWRSKYWELRKRYIERERNQRK